MCICVYLYVCVHVYVGLCMRVHRIYVFMGMCVSEYLYMCVHICVFVYVCAYIFVCICILVCLWSTCPPTMICLECVCICMFVCSCVCVCTCVCVVCISVSVYVHARRCVKCRWPCCDMRLEVRGQLSGVILSFQHEFQWMNSGCQTWRTPKHGIATCVWYAVGDCMVSRNTSVCGNTAVAVRETEAVNTAHL